MKSSQVFILVLASAALAGCAPTSYTKRVKGTQAIDGHTRAVCFLETPVPEGIHATKLGQLVAQKAFYGGSSDVMDEAATQARRTGADFVVNVETVHRMSMIALARPMVRGYSYKLDAGEKLDCAALGGTMR